MDVDIETHPNPQPNPHHRKIDLQSANDLTYLQNNLATFALQKLNLHFPKLSKPATYISLDLQAQPNEKSASTDQGQASGRQDDNKDEDEEDPMRQRVRDLVQEFLTTTWQSASHNISVNGIDASSLSIPHTATLSPTPPQPLPSTTSLTSTPATDRVPPAEIEGIHFQHSPFDASLQHKLASLYGELEALTAQVSKLRRTAPAQGADTYQHRLRAAMDADDARWDDDSNNTADTAEGLEINNVPRQGWNRDVQDTYDHGLSQLAGLAGVDIPQQQQSHLGSSSGGRGPTLTETVGKAQRARTVAMEME